MPFLKTATKKNPVALMERGIEQLFGSKMRVRLLRLFINNPHEKFFVREIGRRVGAQIHAVRRELENLIKIGIITIDEASSKGIKKYYVLNPDSYFYPELRLLLMKSQAFVEKSFTERVKDCDGLKYVALMGYFTGDDDARVDVCMIATEKMSELIDMIKSLEHDVGKELRYTFFTEHEFRYRMSIADSFVWRILDAKKVVALNTMDL